jgi:membrane protease YdiL (CAAX protease family)
VNFNWAIVVQGGLLALGGAAIWLFFGTRLHRLDRAPRRLIAFSPLVGGALVIAMIIAGQAGAVIAAQAFNVALIPPPDEARTIADMVVIMLGVVAAQGIVLIAYMHLLFNARRPLQDNRMKPMAAAVFGVGALLLFWPMVHVVGWIATRIAAMVVGPIDPVAHDTLAMLIAAEPDAWFFMMIALVVIAVPILEEVLYRGILQETLGQLGLGRWAAILVTSAIFAVMHAQVAAPWALVTLFALSLGFGWSYEKTGRLAAPIVMHVLFNAGNIVLALMIT